MTFVVSPARPRRRYSLAFRPSTLAIAGFALSLQTPFTAYAQQPNPPGVAPPATPQAAPPRPANPFLPPLAKLTYAPDRDYDLQHLAVTLDVNYAKRTFRGTAANTLAPLRAGGLRLIRLHAGPALEIEGCAVDGKAAPWTRDGAFIVVTAPATIPQGKPITVAVRYTGGSAQGGGFGQAGGGGFHWINGSPAQPSRVGFWTQGESSSNRDWAPTWDYPNDFATTETTTTVQEGWSVIGNGLLVGETANKAAKTHTFHWKMDQPHATYLLSLAAGPLEIKKAAWRGKPLYYVVPKGKAKLIDDSFSDTPDMLDFFSRITGVPYAWPKYAQNAMYDFGGGMENVSATTLGSGSLTDRRDGFRDMASLNSHELAHQWFGDLVTCKDWGQTWLNESFATFFQALYFEHSRGLNGYMGEIDGDMTGYIRSSRRYKRPIATNLYPSEGAMFDQHAYPKGGAVLHTLRRQMGDAAFFSGIKLYLTRNRHRPVESPDLSRALTDASGFNASRFFDQWVYKPGHPVLDYAWTFDDAKREVVVMVKQTQDTSDGTPIYDLPAKIGIVPGAEAGATRSMARVAVRLNAATQEFRLPSPLGKPDAVLLDPDHDFLREIPTLHWTKSEQYAIAEFAPNGGDRTEALRRLLADNPDEASVQLAIGLYLKDNGKFPALRSLSPLADLKREALRPVFRRLLTHPNYDRRAEAAQALAALPATPEDTQTFRTLALDPNAPYGVVVAALRALAAWDAKANADVLEKAAQMPSNREVIRLTALGQLTEKAPERAAPYLAAASAPAQDFELRRAALTLMGSVKADEPQTTTALLAALKDRDAQLVSRAATALGERGQKSALPALRAVQAAPPVVSDRGGFLQQLGDVIARLEK